jgi:hypothetical protein
MRGGQRAHDPLHQHGIVGGGQRVGAVQQVQFVLARPRLTTASAGMPMAWATSMIWSNSATWAVSALVESVSLRRQVAVGRHRQALIEAVEIEFQFGRHHRGQPARHSAPERP